MLQNKRFCCPFNGSLTFLYVGSTESCPDNQVAVVGGGVAGLAATASLSEAGFNVVLLEAADYFDGRVKQVQLNLSRVLHQLILVENLFMDQTAL